MDREEYVKRVAKAKKVPVENVYQIIDICEKYGVEPIGNVFLRTPQDVDDIIKMCKERYIDPDINRGYFRRTARDAKDIFDLCEKWKIIPEQMLFEYYADELEETIKYINDNFGRKYLKPNIIVKGKEVLEKSMPCMAKIGLLPAAIRDASVLALSDNEILERTAIVDYLGLRRAKICRDSKEVRLNGIYLLTQKKYQEFIEENGFSQKTLNAQVQNLIERDCAPEL